MIKRHGIGWVLLAFLLVGTLGVTGAGPGLSAEIQKGSLRHDRIERTFLYYLPSTLKPPHKPVPLLLALHGGGGRGRGMVRLTEGRFNALAERDGWIVVYPDGFQREWNDGRYAPAEHPGAAAETDDVGFLSELIDLFVAKYGADPRRVYVTGISNGGLMCNRLACERSDLIAAAAPVAASLSVRLSGMCEPKNPVPMLWINGDEDPLVPYQGGEIRVFWSKRGKVLPVPEAVRIWARRNGCDGDRPRVEILPGRDPSDPTSVRRTIYGNGRTGREVVLYTVHGGGHTWPMGLPYLGERIVGRVSRQIDACDVIWEFLSRQIR